MNEKVGQTILAPLRVVLASDNLVEHEGFTILLLTRGSDRWLHLTMLSVGEVIAVDDRCLRLGLWKQSTAARTLSPSGKATIAAVVERTSYSLAMDVRREGSISLSEGPPSRRSLPRWRRRDATRHLMPSCRMVLRSSSTMCDVGCAMKGTRAALRKIATGTER